MGYYTLDDWTRQSLRRVDQDRLRRLVDDLDPNALLSMGLTSCGSYVEAKCRTFIRAVHDLNAARSDRNIQDKLYDATKAGNDLVHAVMRAVAAMEEQEREAELFSVTDHIIPPLTFTERMHVCVSYQCRKTVNDIWTRGAITFTHVAIPPMDFGVQKPRRKPSASKQRFELQKQLSYEWERLCRSAIDSVRTYLRKGGDPSGIPDKFRARASGGILHNFSTDFWTDAASL